MLMQKGLVGCHLENSERGGRTHWRMLWPLGEGGGRRMMEVCTTAWGLGMGHGTDGIWWQIRRDGVYVGSQG